MKLIVWSSLCDSHCAELQASLQIIEQHLTCSCHVYIVLYNSYILYSLPVLKHCTKKNEGAEVKLRKPFIHQQYKWLLLGPGHSFS